MTAASDPATIPGARESTGPYNLARPTLADARTALHHMYGAHADDHWQQLLTRAGLTGDETDPASFDRMIHAMTVADPVTSLCARALHIRAAAYTHLSAAYALIRDAETDNRSISPIEEHP